MGIQSTVDIRRDQAIYRIQTIVSLCIDNNAMALVGCTYEEDHNIRNFIKGVVDNRTCYNNLDDMLNCELEDILDKPYFRRTMFDNYNVID